MEDRKPQEQPAPLPQQEGETVETISIDQLPEKLRFAETEELSHLRGQLVEALVSGNEDETRKLFIRYHILGEVVVNQLQGEDFPKAQIGLTVAMGLIRRDGGRVDDYIEDLQDALTYADNMGYEDVVTTLEAAIRSARAQVEGQETSEIGDKVPTVTELAEACSEILSDEDREELVEMNMEDALGYAFTLLLENGLDDPAEYLKQKGILE